MAESEGIATQCAQILELPRTIFKRTKGFSMDFGLSVIKIAYALETDGKVCLHFVSFSNEHLDEALQYITATMGADISPGEHVYLTGAGCNFHKEKIEKDLHIKFTLILEFDACPAGFRFLATHCPLEEMLYPPSSEMQFYGWSAAKGLMATLTNITGLSTAGKSVEAHLKQLPEPDELALTAIEFPALVFILGSGLISTSVNEDGSYDMLDFVSTCGRFMMGMGSMIAGIQTYEELVKLAEKGDSNIMNTPMGGAVQEDNDDSYTQLMKDVHGSMSLHHFGKAVGKNRDEFSCEDRAAAVISSATYNIALHCQSMAMFFKAKHVYFIGGLHNSQIVREELGKHFLNRSLMSYNEIHTQPHFVKLGAYCGVLGALLQNLQLAE